jgi:hypothetical protein
MDASTRLERVLDEVRAERDRQDSKWGIQDHPSIRPNLAGALPDTVCRIYGLPPDDEAKVICDTRFRRGDGAYADIAVEELAEAVAAAVTSDAECRAELVQVAAVVVAWIEAIDRRADAQETRRLRTVNNE